jgi:hypothetical protein
MAYPERGYGQRHVFRVVAIRRIVLRRGERAHSAPAQQARLNLGLQFEEARSIIQRLIVRSEVVHLRMSDTRLQYAQLSSRPA